MKRASLLLLCALTGCMDITPIVLEVDGGDAAIVPDVAPAETEAAPSACERCIFGYDDTSPSCAAQVAKCNGMETCKNTLPCALANQCMFGKDFKAIIDCGIPCAKAAGVTDQTSPEAQAIVALVACIVETCKDPCRVP